LEAGAFPAWMEEWQHLFGSAIAAKNKIELSGESFDFHLFYSPLFIRPFFSTLF
jgi:hypothetical protein